MTLTHSPHNGTPDAAAAQLGAPGETARDHIANALQIIAGHPDGYGLGPGVVAGLRRRLRLALAALDDASERERAAAVMLRVERVEIDGARLAAYGYARCGNGKCLGGLVELGRPCQWCGTIATGPAL